MNFRLSNVRVNGKYTAEMIFISSRLDNTLERGDWVIVKGKVNAEKSFAALFVNGEIINITKPKTPDFFLRIRD